MKESNELFELCKKKRPALGECWSLKGVKRRVTTKKSLHCVLYHNSFQMSIVNKGQNDEM